LVRQASPAQDDNENMNEALFLHNQYLRQAAWTRALRLFLYRKVHLARKRNILELGSGSGVISDEISRRTAAKIVGIDDDPRMTAFAGKRYPHLDTRTARAEKLPFRAGAFDLIVTHCFWLWQKDPQKVLAEARRVMAEGGLLVSLCEPDYPGRRDEPEELDGIRDLLMEALSGLGAYPDVPGKLGALMSRAGFKTECGRQENRWGWRECQKEFEAEWKFIGHLCGPGKNLVSIKRKDRKAVAERTRKLLMPVCWAVGTKL